jgi:hypothetical protein
MPLYRSTKVRSIHDFLDAVRADTADWDCVGHVRPWFRGQADAGRPPVPSVLRRERASKGHRSRQYDEFHMTTMFRLKALALGRVPETARLDQWLFLMQHHGLPTRLLDWTENPLAACFFAASSAARSEKPKSKYKDRVHMAVWVLHPIRLNMMTDGALNDFPNTWKQSECLENFKIAFGTAGLDKIPLAEGGYRIFKPTRLPLAVQPSTIAPRIAVQKGCFTVHGRDRRDFEALFQTQPSTHRRYFRKYLFRRDRAPKLVNELEQMGVSDSTLFPDLDGLTREMKDRFFLDRLASRRGSSLAKLD